MNERIEVILVLFLEVESQARKLSKNGCFLCFDHDIICTCNL